MADEFGFRRIRDGEIAGLRRLPPRELLQHLDVPLWKVPLIARRMRRMKRDALAAIPLFPGAAAMLQALSDGGTRLALVSSDHEVNARVQLGGAAELFSHYACGASLFGKAQKFRRVLRQAGVAPGRAIAIGDELRDIEAARTAGLACGAVAWGYADPAALAAAGPDHMFAAMADIPSSLR